MLYRVLVLLTGCLLVACSTHILAPATEEWMTEESIAFASYSDGRGIELTDGRALEVLLSTAAFNRIEQLAKGTPGTLHYSTERGLHLRFSDVEIEVISVPGDAHPIERHRARLMDADESTAGMVIAYEWSARVWRQEIQRLIRKLRRDSSPEVAAKLERLGRAWSEFDHAANAVAADIFGQANGTIWLIEAAVHRSSTARNFADSLSELERAARLAKPQS